MDLGLFLGFRRGLPKRFGSFERRPSKLLEVDLPGEFVGRPVGPPGDARGEVLELDRPCLRVTLAAFRERHFVEPDISRRSRAVEEQEVRLDRRIGGEDPAGQSNDRVKIEILGQFVLDPGTNPVAEECAVGHDNGGSARLGQSPQLPHDQLEEEQRGFRRLLVAGEASEDAAFFLAAEGWVCQDDVDPFAVTDLGDLLGEAVTLFSSGDSSPCKRRFIWASM